MSPYFIMLDSVDPVVATYRDNQGFQGGSTPWTLTSMAIGTAFSTRRVIIAIGAASTSTVNTNVVTGVTIGGVSATLLDIRRHTSNSYHETSFWYADVSTGTTANVVITSSGARASMNVNALWTLDNTLLQSSSVSASGIDNTASASPLSVTLSVPDGGFILAVHTRQSGSGTCTWGGTGISEVSDNPLNVSQPGNSVQSAASGNYTTGGSIVVTCTPSGTSATQLLHVIAMR